MTSILPIPVSRYLVPEREAAPPDGFTRLRQSLDGGVPALIRLDAALVLVLFVPTGDAALWHDADAGAVAASADDERAARGPAETIAPTATARLLLRRGADPLAVVPLRAGACRRLPDDGGAVGALVELRVLDFYIAAGSLRGAGAYGSFVDLAWRRIDRGSDRFALPAVDARVAERFAGVFQSEIGAP